MSYCVHPVAVSLRKLEKALGSGKTRLLKKIAQRNSSDFDEIDEIDDDDEVDEDGVTTPDALSHLIMGQPLNERYGFKYGYALLFLCEFLGDTLSNNGWCAMRSAWFDEVDDVLEQAGIEENVFRTYEHLIGRGAPVALPMIEDFPTIGFIRNEEMPAIAAALTTSGIDPDDEVGESLQEVVSWLEHCQRKKLDLVCFYY